MVSARQVKGHHLVLMIRKRTQMLCLLPEALEP